MVFASMRAAPPTPRNLRHWERVCRFLDAQPYRAVSLPVPVDLPMSVRLFKRMAVFRLVRHRVDCQLAALAPLARDPAAAVGSAAS